MLAYVKENPDIVWAYQQVIAGAYNTCPAVKAGVDNVIDLMRGRVRSYAVLIAMGYGSQEARNTLLPLFVANRLDRK